MRFPFPSKIASAPLGELRPDPFRRQYRAAAQAGGLRPRDRARAHVLVGFRLEHLPLDARRPLVCSHDPIPKRLTASDLDSVAAFPPEDRFLRKPQ